MAVNLSTNTLSPVVRNTNFSETINITTTDEEIAGVIIRRVNEANAILAADSGITISVDATGHSAGDDLPITFSGSYEDLYDQDKIKSFPEGKSVAIVNAVFDESGNIISPERDLTDEEFELKKQEFPTTVKPTITTGFASIPENHIVYSAIQDPRETIVARYMIEINYSDSGIDATESEILTHTVNTDTTAFQNALKALFP